MEPHSAGPPVSGFSHSASRFRGPPVGQQVSALHSFFFYGQLIFHRTDRPAYLSVHLAVDTAATPWLSRMRAADVSVLVPASAFSV